MCIICPKCGNVMEETGLNVWCNTCKKMYYDLIKTTKVYVASSWRNKYQPMVVKAIKKAGVDVYDFRHPVEGDNGFHWSQIDKDWQSWTPKKYAENLKHPIAKDGYYKDIDALNQCDICILVMPCGRSAHLEFGYHMGKYGKGAILILEPCEPELMYRMANYIFTDLESLTSWVKKEQGGDSNSSHR